MLGYKAFGAGLSGLAVQAICKDVATGLTSTGTTQADAYEVTTDKAAFSTVAANSGAKLSSMAAAGDSQLIYNGGVNPLKVYPPSGAKINGLATNAAVLLPVKTPCRFECFSSTQWTGMLSA